MLGWYGFKKQNKKKQGLLSVFQENSSACVFVYH